MNTVSSTDFLSLLGVSRSSLDSVGAVTILWRRPSTLACSGSLQSSTLQAACVMRQHRAESNGKLAPSSEFAYHQRFSKRGFVSLTVRCGSRWVLLSASIALLSI